MKFLLPSIVFFLFACKTIAPVAPVEIIEKTSKTPIPVISTFAIPVSIDLKPYFKLAEKQVPPTFTGKENPCEGIAFEYFFDRNPIVWSGNKQTVNIDVSGKYWLKASYCVKCSDLLSEKPYCLTPRIPFSCGIGEPMRRMRLQMSSEFALTPNYGINTKTRLSDLQALDPCEVSVFSYDATGQLIKETTKALEKVAKDLDIDLSKMNFKKEVSEIWKQAEQPIAIENYGFLHFQPEQLGVSAPQIVNNQLKATVFIDAFPVLSSTKEFIHKELPLLKVNQENLSDTFQVHLDLKLDYDSISKQIQKMVGGQKILLKKREVIFDSIFVSGAAKNQLLFKVVFSGKKEGTLYLKGTPELNATTQFLEFSDLDYSLETKSVLLKSAKWLFDKRILEELKKSSSIDVKPYLKTAKKSIDDNLKQDFEGFLLNGKVKNLNILFIQPAQEKLLLRALCTGKLSISN